MLILAFFLALLATIFQGILIPQIQILPFVPFLSLVLMKCKPHNSLWIAALTGAFIDTLSDDPMGLHALNYVIVVGLFTRFRNYFSFEKPLHLSLFSFCISFSSISLQLLLLFLFDRRIPFGGKWTFVELIGMSLIDTLYAFIWFAVPITLTTKLRQMCVLFWLQRKNRSPTSH